MKKRRTWSPALKLEALNRLEQGDKTADVKMGQVQLNVRVADAL